MVFADVSSAGRAQGVCVRGFAWPCGANTQVLAWHPCVLPGLPFLSPESCLSGKPGSLSSQWICFFCSTISAFLATLAAGVPEL